MKPVIMMVGALLVAAVSIAAPLMVENPGGLEKRREEVAYAEWAASTNALSVSNFVALVEASRNFQELKDAILRKARSDEAQAVRERAKVRK